MAPGGDISTGTKRGNLELQARRVRTKTNVSFNLPFSFFGFVLESREEARERNWRGADAFMYRGSGTPRVKKSKAEFPVKYAKSRLPIER